MYGSLRSRQLRRRLLGRDVRGVPAQLVGFVRIPIPGSLYPGLAYAPGRTTEGELLLGVSRRDLAVLDRYEGPQYIRRLVWVEAHGQKHRAWVYFWRGSRPHLRISNQ